jgi:hypothetical protein
MSAADMDPFDDLKFQRDLKPGQDVDARIRRACTSNLEPAHPLSRQRRLLLTAVVALAGLVAMLAFGLRHGTELHSGAESALWGALGWASVLLVVLGIGVARPPGKRLGAATRLLVATLVPLFFFCYLALGASDTLPLDHALDDGGTLGCGLFTLLSSAVVALGVILPWRRTDPFNPTLTGALLGLGGGLVAAIAMGVVCPCHEGWHLWLAHGASLVIVVLIGAWVGRRWLAP